MAAHPLDYAFRLANLVSTCRDCPDACVVTNENGHVLATGVTGMVSGSRLPCRCPRTCQSLHAAERAIAAAGKQISKARKLYCVRAPCQDCITALYGTPINEIIFVIEDLSSPSRLLWERTGRTWTHRAPSRSMDLNHDDTTDDDQP